MKFEFFLIGLLAVSVGFSKSHHTERIVQGEPLDLSGVNLNPTIDPAKLSKECSTFISTTLPQQNWEGAFIEVPENWNDPEGKKVLIFYYSNKVHAPADSQPPIVFFNGGPFQSLQSRMPLIKKSMDKFDKKQHWMIMFDQRGTGCSANGIPEVPVVNQETAKRWSHYGSAAIAKDAEAIRIKLLSDKRWTVFGHSFGGLPAVRYIDLFPEHVEKLHLYAPALVNSFSDFYFYRIKREQENIQKFLATYPNDDLKSAFEKIRSDVGQTYCIYGNEPKAKVCGQPVSDLFLANLGQGYGKDLGTMDVWDPIKNAMLGMLKNVDPTSTTDLDLKLFYTQATNAGGFFHNATINMVYVIWAQDIAFINGNPDADCVNAYQRLEEVGLVRDHFLSDQCRITKNVVSPDIKNALQENFLYYNGADKLDHARVKEIFKKTTHEIKKYLYTGDLDSVVSKDAVSDLGLLKGISHINFKNSGHSGFLFEPEFWNTLLEN